MPAKKHLSQYDTVQDVVANVPPKKLAEWIYWYAYNVIQGRFPDAEPVLC